MSVEATLCCDECGRIIAADSTPAMVRKIARADSLFQRIKGQELCTECVAIQYPSRTVSGVQSSPRTVQEGK